MSYFGTECIVLILVLFYRWQTAIIVLPNPWASQKLVYIHISSVPIPGINNERSPKLHKFISKFIQILNLHKLSKVAHKLEYFTCIILLSKVFESKGTGIFSVVRGSVRPYLLPVSPSDNKSSGPEIHRTFSPQHSGHTYFSLGSNFSVDFLALQISNKFQAPNKFSIRHHAWIL
jgi:hypothetical protein